MAEGLFAHATGDCDLAWRRLESALPRLQEIGGSHAQRDLFEQIFLDTALKSGRLVDAQQRLELRRHADPDGVPVNRALAGVYGQLRLPGLAAQAQARAARTEARFTRYRACKLTLPWSPTVSIACSGTSSRAATRSSS